MPEAEATTSGSPPAARAPLVEPPAPGPELPDFPQPQRPGSAGPGRAALLHPQPGHSRKFPLSLFSSSATRNLRAASERALRRGAGCSQALLAALPGPSCQAVCAGRCHGHLRQDGLCNKPLLTFLIGKNFPGRTSPWAQPHKLPPGRFHLSRQHGEHRGQSRSFLHRGTNQEHKKRIKRLKAEPGAAPRTAPSEAAHLLRRRTARPRHRAGHRERKKQRRAERNAPSGELTVRSASFSTSRSSRNGQD